MGYFFEFKAFSRTYLKVSLYQREAEMGIPEAYLDDEPTPKSLITGYFEGYPWVEKGARKNGRLYIANVFENLENKNHVITFKVSDTPVNPKIPGHKCQIVYQIVYLLFSTMEVFN